MRASAMLSPVIELVQECRSNEGWQPVEVQSSSNPDHRYTVLTATWLAPQEFICECEGYRFRNRCHHQREALKKLCRWTEVKGPETQSSDQKKMLVCPRCGGPTRRTMEEIDE